MKYTMMHRRVRVAELEMNEATGMIQKVSAVYAPEHLPVGVPLRQGTADRAALNEWWADRAIPDSRTGIRAALQALGVASPQTLPLCCCGLSLSDQYWISPEGAGLIWDDINFFENDFSGDLGKILFCGEMGREAPELFSPDCTTDGNLKKRWEIIDGRRCLVKGGSEPFCQQPFNEVIAAGLMERLGIAHVPYTLAWRGGVPYSVCEDLVTKDTELVPAWRIYRVKKKDNSTSVYRHFLNCCDMLGIRGAAPFLDRMMVLDYIIADEDRHMNNFGVLRNAETLEWLGFAPIYDSGTSLGYDKQPGQMRTDSAVVCKPFKSRHQEQLKLVSDLSWVDYESLSDGGEFAEEILSANGAEGYTGKDRIRAIADGIQRRVAYLSRLAAANAPAQADSTRNDVERNIAADYAP
ncbi:MAG: excisionase [Oscillospiraceae bacterium]|nr:excisionase [Oscillospiraceae bacterium]